ncbi:hypothetical protein K432DRAFT_420396 [Lepidopterella palustris CBS 459.81]|uniref:BTB domain-containing protein n=1 Tax=Lepidopterella palustris CBS 459.81 TaxID=1314670 RepID=A0A8E2DZ58_9PEZI|nr:hypothetical protein K432DRAFT_420396 [Lepidopterella palustris CBS 459.81]
MFNEKSPYFKKAFQELFVKGNTKILKFQDGNNISNKDLEEDPKLFKNLRVYTLADMFFLENLKLLALKKSNLFPECVQEVYKSTYKRDRIIRSTVVEAAATYVRKLGIKGIFKDLIYKGRDFAVNYIQKPLAENIVE